MSKNYSRQPAGQTAFTLLTVPLILAVSGLGMLMVFLEATKEEDKNLPLIIAIFTIFAGVVYAIYVVIAPAETGLIAVAFGLAFAIRAYLYRKLSTFAGGTILVIAGLVALAWAGVKSALQL